jgi:hypothetical protein
LSGPAVCGEPADVPAVVLVVDVFVGKLSDVEFIAGADVFGEPPSDASANAFIARREAAKKREAFIKNSLC